MARKKKRRVDVVSAKLSFLKEDSNNPSFSDILDFIDGKTMKLNEEKSIEFSLLKTSLQKCKIGIIITMQGRDLPPKRDIETRKFSPLQINPKKEKLAFANIFLYDEERNIFIYEVNKNGCYPNLLIEAIHYLCRRKYKDYPFELRFPSVLRKNEYNRMLRMAYFKKLRVELYDPSDLVDCFVDSTDSDANKILRQNIRTAKKANADTIVIEQAALTKKINPMGLSRSLVKETIDSVIHYVVDKGYRKNIESLEVVGYFEDPEEPKSARKVNIIADTFDETFSIEDIQIQTDVQVAERQKGIEDLYLRRLSEFKSLKK